MKTFESINSLDIYELNNIDQFGIDMPKLTVKNHWNRSQFVVIQMPSGESATVNASALIKAVRNAENAHQ